MLINCEQLIVNINNCDLINVSKLNWIYLVHSLCVYLWLRNTNYGGVVYAIYHRYKLTQVLMNYNRVR